MKKVVPTIFIALLLLFIACRNGEDKKTITDKEVEQIEQENAVLENTVKEIEDKEKALEAALKELE